MPKSQYTCLLANTGMDTLRVPALLSGEKSDGGARRVHEGSESTLAGDQGQMNPRFAVGVGSCAI